MDDLKITQFIDIFSAVKINMMEIFYYFSSNNNFKVEVISEGEVMNYEFLEHMF